MRNLWTSCTQTDPKRPCTNLSPPPAPVPSLPKHNNCSALYPKLSSREPRPVVLKSCLCDSCYVITLSWFFFYLQLLSQVLFWVFLLCQPLSIFLKALFWLSFPPSVSAGQSPLLLWPQILSIDWRFPNNLQVSFLSWTTEPSRQSPTDISTHQTLNSSPHNLILLSAHLTMYRALHDQPLPSLYTSLSLLCASTSQAELPGESLSTRAVSARQICLRTYFSFCLECCLPQPLPLSVTPLKITWLIPA